MVDDFAAAVEVFPPYLVTTDVSEERIAICWISSYDDDVEQRLIRGERLDIAAVEIESDDTS